MVKKCFAIAVGLLLMVSCYEPQRNCAGFKNGTFTFTAVIDGADRTTTFIRKDSMEIDLFEGRRDTAAIRWINDCEYIVRKTNPMSIAEGKSVHMKIISTTDSTYTFEYGMVGSTKKVMGTAVKIE